MARTQKITTHLWFNGNAEEAVEFYTSVFPDSRVTNVARWGEGGPGPQGTVLNIAFETGGPVVHRPEWRATVHVHSGDFALCDLRVPGRCGRPVDEVPRRRRQTQRVRMARRPLRPLVADRSGGADRADERSRPEGVGTRRAEP